MKFLAVSLAAIVLCVGAKNVPRPRLPSWSNDGATAPILPPLPRFRLRGGGEYAAAPTSGEYLDGKDQRALDRSGECRCLECKCRTERQSIEVAVIGE